MNKFDAFWETVAGRFPSETSAYFAKPLLREAFNAGRASVPKGKTAAVDDTIDRAPDALLHAGRD